MKFRCRLPKSNSFELRWPFIFFALAASVIFILTSGFVATRMDSEFVVQTARVLTADDSLLTPDPYVQGMKIGRQPVTVELTQGDHRGDVFAVENMLSRAFNIYCAPGTEILVNVRTADGDIVGLDIFGYNRSGMIYLFVLLFAALLIVLGRKKGFYSLFSLAFTMIAVVFFLLPRLLAGDDPVVIALLTAVLTTAVSIFIISGMNTKSISAILGIVLGVAVAALSALVAGEFGHVTGLQMPEAQEVIYLSQDYRLQVTRLLFAGVIVAALGAVMDVGMSIASAVFEIRRANADYTCRQLYKSGMNIGRDMMGTMSNTLILAFAGSSLPILLIIMLYNLPHLRLINLDLLGVELVQGLAGSLGLIITIPLTALVSSFFAIRMKAEAAHVEKVDEFSSRKRK